MQLLISFIIKFKYFITFFVLQVISFILFISFNNYPNSRISEFRADIVGGFYKTKDNFLKILYLENDIEKLSIENIKLKQKLEFYQKEISAQIPLDSTITKSHSRQFDYTYANVIKNSLNYSNNYIIIDKGLKNGLKQDLGIISSKGIVGIINGCTNNYSNVISLLNTKIKINARIKNSNYYGSIIWDGKDPRFVDLIDIPRYQSIKKGEIIETDGKSSVFPEGIAIGSIYKIYRSEETNDYILKVKLFEDFNKIRNVYVVTNIDKIEIDSLINKQEVIDEKF